MAHVGIQPFPTFIHWDNILLIGIGPLALARTALGHTYAPEALQVVRATLHF